MANNYNMKQFSSTAAIAENAMYPSTTSIDMPNTNIDFSKKNDRINNNEKEYNPFEHRSLEHPNSTGRSFANLLKSSLGSGILAMPSAFKNAGSIVGIIGTVILGFICTHCVYMLVKTQQDVCKVVKSPSLGYAETVEAVFKTGPKPLQRHSRGARIFLDCAMAVTILGACSLYVLLLVQSIKQIFDFFYPETIISLQMYCLMAVVPFLIFTQIKNLKYIAPFSAVANILLVITFAICIYYIFEDFPDMASRDYYTSIEKLPLFMGTVIFAMEGIGVVLPIENTMLKPQKFLSCPGVLNISMSVVVALYLSMGLLGYIRYGSEAHASITLNLPMNEIGSLAAKVFIVIAIFFTYILQFYVPMEIIWRNTRDYVDKKYHNRAQIFMRAFFAVATVALAAVFPNLEQVIELQGAFFYSFLGLIAPSFLEMIFNWERNRGKWNYLIWKDLILALFGSFVLVTGCSKSLSDIFFPTINEGS